MTKSTPIERIAYICAAAFFAVATLAIIVTVPAVLWVAPAVGLPAWVIWRLWGIWFPILGALIACSAILAFFAALFWAIGAAEKWIDASWIAAWIEAKTGLRGQPSGYVLVIGVLVFCACIALNDWRKGRQSEREWQARRQERLRQGRE